MSPEGAIAGGGAEGYVGLWGGLLIKRLESVLQSIESFLEAGDAGVAVLDRVEEGLDCGERHASAVERAYVFVIATEAERGVEIPRDRTEVANLGTPSLR